MPRVRLVFHQAAFQKTIGNLLRALPRDRLRPRQGRHRGGAACEEGKKERSFRGRGSTARADLCVHAPNQPLSVKKFLDEFQGGAGLPATFGTDGTPRVSGGYAKRRNTHMTGILSY